MNAFIFAALLAGSSIAVTPQYLEGEWYEPGSGAECGNEFTWKYLPNRRIVIDETPEPYRIVRNEVHYLGIDSPTYDVIKPVTVDHMKVKMQNGDWFDLYRCPAKTG